MKISIEAYGKTHTTEITHDESDINEIVDIFYGLLVCTTFSEKTIINGFKEFVDEKEYEKTIEPKKATPY
ncbi:hypothetical protein UFOVP516_35 [uncultured Caudovirales phage]|uniref:Uncharacterized protein n=1 Tax=uncultured Caudovirales phage TaxID=2100421 RepID=A0A6J5MR75_9CAUD|nr:hypothetical protein UFOVP516_35 [uncultured Caudovirales phage]